MKKSKKLLFALLLTVMAMAMLGGCGKNKNTVTIDKDAIYRQEEQKVDLPKGLEPDRFFIAGDRVYFLGYTYDDMGSTQYWGSFNVDGSDVRSYKVETGENYQYVSSFDVTKSGEAVLDITQYIDEMDGEEYISTVIRTINLYSVDGKKIKSVDISNLAGDDDWIYRVECIDDKIVVLSSKKRVIYSASLELEKEIKVDNYEYYDNIVDLGNGSYITTIWGEVGQEIHKFDIDKYEAGDKIDIPFSISSYEIVAGGKSGYDILLRDATSIKGFKFGDAEPKEIVNFVDSDIYAEGFLMLSATDTNEFVGVSYEWSDNGGTINYNKYVKINPEDYVEKKVITLGTMYGGGSIKKDVIDFNKSNPDYRIKLITYDSYNSEVDWDAGQKKFNSDIVSGNGPDIIVSYGADAYMQYAGKGLFADLGKFIDKDPDIDRNDLFPNVLEACTVNGKIIALSPTFYINTAVAKSSLLNGRTSWTIQEMIDFEKTLPEDSELFQFSSRYTFLNNILGASGDYFINEKDAKCNFNSPDFIALLEYLKTLPEEPDYGYDGPIMYDKVIDDDYESRWRNNKVIMYETSFSDIRYLNSLEKGTFGEEITFIGYPCADGNGSSMYFGNMYAISSKSKNAEGAWSFVRQYFTKEAFSKLDYGYPLSMSRFDELAEEAKKKPFYIDYLTGEKVEYDEEYYINGESIPISPASAECVAKLKNFIMSVNKTVSYHDDIIAIIEEETAPFFEGQKSAADVANIIQGRADIYIKEKQ